MDRAPPEVYDLFRVAKRPARIERAAGVASIGSRHRVAALQPPIHRRVDQRSREAAVADALVFAVPRRRGRKPHLKRDIRVGGRPDRALYAAEGGVYRNRRRRILADDAGRRRDVGSSGSSRVAEGPAGEASAIRSSGATGARERACGDCASRRKTKASGPFPFQARHGPLLLNASRARGERHSDDKRPRLYQDDPQRSFSRRRFRQSLCRLPVRVNCAASVASGRGRTRTHALMRPTTAASTWIKHWP
jgi:hypothetical protein